MKDLIAATFMMVVFTVLALIAVEHSIPKEIAFQRALMLKHVATVCDGR